MMSRETDPARGSATAGSSKAAHHYPIICMKLFDNSKRHIEEAGELLDEMDDQTANYFLTQSPSVSGATVLVEAIDELREQMAEACGLVSQP